MGEPGSVYLEVLWLMSYAGGVIVFLGDEQSYSCLGFELTSFFY